MDIKKCALTMKIVIEQNGLAPGGLNFDCKVRRKVLIYRIFYFSHWRHGCLRRGIRIALNNFRQTVINMVKNRYSSFDNIELGRRLRMAPALG